MNREGRILMKKIKSFILVLVVGIMMFGMTLTVRADNTSGEWRYILQSGEAALTEYLGDCLDIQIPLSIDGYPVTVIGEDVFKESNITSVNIPFRIEDIWPDAFADCKYLKNIYFDAKNCANIHHDSFRNAGKFSESLTVTFGPSVKRIPSWLFYASENNYAHVTNVIIPENVQVIGEWAFRNCFDLSNLSLKDGLIEIGGSAFENCMGLSTLTIPKTTEEIGSAAFAGLKYLTQINFNAVDCHVYYFRSGMSLHAFVNAGKFSNGVTVKFGEGVKKVPTSIFEAPEDSYAHITSIILPQSVNEIGEFAFNNCYDLKKITFLSKVTEFPTGNYYYPFDNCSSNLIFECYRGSTAAGYAKNNGFKISYIDSAIDISECNVKLGTTKYTYRGKENRPSVSLTYGSRKLIRDKDYTVTYRNNKYVGTASVIITGKGEFEGSVTKKFTIVPKGTVISWLSPVRKGIDVGIKKQTSQTTGYEVQCYINSKFTNPKSIFTTKNTTTTAQIRKLSAGRKYYVRVRTYKTVAGKKYYSEWSPVNAIVTRK